MNLDEYTIDEKVIKVSGGHKIYSQLWGNVAAKTTIVYLHGGPGSGTSNHAKQLFDPEKQQVIFFDQRGAGKSLPHGKLESNTTSELADDINQVTKAYGVEEFVITGSSWGSCLALVYAIHNPRKVIAMVLRGIFTGRESEIDFVDKGRFREFFPETWDRFVKTVPEGYKENPMDYHHKHLIGSDAQSTKASALAISQLEYSLICLDDRNKPLVIEEFDPVPTIIEQHYLVNNCFLSQDFVLKNASKLTMPIKLIQGRYDMVCPAITAYELNAALPNSQLYWTVAGHTGSDRANFDTNKALLSDYN